MNKITTLCQAVASNTYFSTRMNRSSQPGKRNSLPIAFTLVLTLLLSLVKVGDVWGQTTFSTGTASGNFTWYCPPGVTSITVECWGAGGRGGTLTANGSGGGGGGGAYSRSVISVTPGVTYLLRAGAGSTSTAAGGDSYFGNSTAGNSSGATVLAKGGASAADNSTTGAIGGASGSGVGTVKYSGGNGWTTTITGGGGGGSSAGTAANGNNATSTSGATAQTGGGAGGAGRTSTQGNGTAGTAPGGGGGGALRTSFGTRNGGAGAAGRVSITYTCPAATIPWTEGFETGYANNTAVVGCWSQSSVTGNEVWTANSSAVDYNRTPRTGFFNAFLQYSNEDWLFYPVQLTGGTSYKFEVYARQDMATSTDANITLAYGSSASAGSMTTITGPTGIINGGYQNINGTFTPASSGVYYMGIKGFMNGTPWYISLDDISVTVAPPSMNSFSPASLCAGGTITISGTNFSGVTGVTVNGTSVSSFNVVNSTTITAITSNSQTSGAVTITNAGGSSSSGSITVNPLPSITSSGVINAVCSSTSSQTTTLAYTATTSSPSSYQLDWNAAANTAGLVDGTLTPFSFVSTGGTINIPVAANVAAGVYSGTLNMTNANGCLGPQAVSLTLTLTPTIGGVAQTTPFCYNPINNSNATITLSGLLNSTAQTATYTIGSGSAQTISFTSSATGTATLSIPVTFANNGQALTITSINCANFSSNNSVVLNILNSPAAPTVVSGTQTVNVGAQATFTASRTAGTNNPLTWWTAASAGTEIDPDGASTVDSVFNSYQASILSTPTVSNVAFCIPNYTTAASSTYKYYVQQYDGTCPSTRTEVVVLTNPLVTSNSVNNLICQSGATITLSANVIQESTGSSIQWTSATTANASFTNAGTSQLLTVNPSISTMYQLNTASLMPNGCTNSTFTTTALSTQQNILVYPSLDFTPTANPSQVCLGGTTSLIPNTPSGNFSVSPITFQPSTEPASGVTTLSISGQATVPLSGGDLDDGGWGNIPIGFTYNYFGSPFTTLGVGTNGLVMFGTIPGYGTSAGQLGQWQFATPTFPNSGNPGNVIGLMLSDMRFTTNNGGNGVLKYWTEGFAPTRRFVLSGVYPQYNGGALTTVQLKLYETSGIAEVHITSSAATIARSVGLQSAIPVPVATPTGALAPGWNSRTTTLTTPEAWRFSPPATYDIKWYLGQGQQATLLANYPYVANAPASTYNYATQASQAGSPGQVTYTVSATNTNTNCPSSQTLAITVNALPVAPNSGGNVTACNNATSTTLSATAPTGCVVDWYANAQGTGTPLASGSSTYSFTPPATPNTYTYYAFSRNSTTGCISSSGAAIILTVVASPDVPLATTSVNPSYCEGSTPVQLGATALAGNTLNWYTGSLSSSASTTAPTPSTATNTGSPFLYYATQVSGSNGCESNPTTFTVTVNNTPAAPVYSATVNGSGFTISPVGTITYCQGVTTYPIWINAGAANLLNNPPTTQQYWYYSAPTGTAGQTSTSPTPSSASAGTITYYVSRKNTSTGCEGPRTPVNVVINPSVTPLVSISTTSASTCAGSPYVFTATPTYGGTAPTYAWALGSASVGTNSSTFTYTDAYDQASNYGSSWTNGSNLGTGFSPWAINIETNTGAFIGNPANDGSGTSGIGTTAFGIYATGSAYLNARRPIVNGMMVGEELSFYWIFNWDAGSGNKGFDLKSGTTTVFNVNNTGSSTITTTNGTANTNYGTTPMLVTLTRTSSTQYNFSMTSRSGGATYTTTINNAANIDGVDFYIGDQNNGASQRNLYFNHLRKTLASGAQIGVTMTSNYANCLFTPTATSTPIVMTGAPVAPSVSITQSTNTTICVGTSVTFSVLSGLNMGSTPTYAWKLNGVTVGTSATYTTTSLTNNDVVTLSMTSSLPSSCLSSPATANSNAITMTVTPATAITAQPANASVCLGGSQSLSVTAVGTGTITYQWQSSTSPTGTFSNISFASNSSSQSATLSVPSVAGQLSYQLVANSSCGTATSNVATISINQATVINTQPQTQTVCQGSPVTFSVGAIGTGTLTYQWRYNGAPISGATASSYNIPSLALGDAGAYSVVVTATCGSVTSANAQLTVTPLTTISVQPVGSTVCAGSPVNLSVTAAGTGNLTYQWMQNGTAVSGATSALYPIQSSLVSQSGSYTVVVAGGCSSLTSSAATVVVNTVTAINTQPQSYTGCAFTPTSLTVGAVGTNLTYAWSVGTTAITNATSASYSLANPQTSNSGNYTVVVTGVCGTQTSNIALVTINPLPSPGIISGGSNGVCVGATTTLTNNVSGGAWTSNNLSIATVNAATGVVTGVAAANATIIYSVTNSFGCVSTSSKVVQVKALPTAVILPPSATQFCIGESMNLQASNAFAYLWSNGATTQTTTVTTSGSYTVTATGNNGCTATSAPLVISVIPAPSVAPISGSSNLCVGSSYNFTSATANGLWTSSNPSVVNVNPNSGLVTASAAGTATLTYNVANVPGCLNTNPGSATTSVTVNTPPVAQITVGGATTFCQGGSVTLTANTGASYLWSNGATTQSISATSSGSYTVTVTNANGCSTTSIAVPVTVNPAPNASIFPGTSVNVCAGSSVTLSTGTAAAYAWSNGATTPTISVNTAGTYAVTLTGSNGCTATSASTTVAVTSLPTANITSSGSTSICQGSSVSLSATAGTGYTYLWSTGAATQTISPTASGAYSVTVTNNGCSATSAATSVNVIPTPSASITASGPLTFCDGGSVTLSAPSGNGFTYAWSNGSIAQNITSAVSGSFSVTVSNSFGCSSTSSVVAVTVNPLPAISAISGPSTICMGNSGNFTHAVSGGIYSVANTAVVAVGQASGAITPVAPGSTLVTYTYSNAFGCSNAVTQTFSVNPSPTASISPLGATTFCQGGSVDIQASTGASSYLWSNGATTPTISATTSGAYTVVVSNAFGCTATSNAINVNVNPAPNATIYPGTAVNICSGSSVTLSTGTAAAYLWSNGSTAPTITVNTVGSYSVLLTGSNGCTSTSQVTAVTVTPVPVASISANGPTSICQGASVTLTAAPATSYLWNNGATTQSISVSTVGSYFVNVGTGACSATSSPVFVSYNPVPQANITPSGPTTFCQGGQVTLNGPSGNGYTYLWSNGATTQGVSTANPGTFSVTVTNAYGCSSTSAVQAVAVNPLPTVTPITGAATLCSNGQTQLTNVMTGGIYTSFNLNVASIGNTSGLVSGLGAGTTTISYLYTDINGCSNTVYYPITVVPAPTPTIDANGTTSICQGGSLTLNASSGASYSWNTGATTSSITTTAGGSYFVTVTAANGCAAQSQIMTLTVNPLPTVATTSGSSTVCSNGTTLLSNATGGGVWSSSNTTLATVNPSTGLVTGVAAGALNINYTLTNSSGCSAVSSKPMTVITPTAATVSTSGSTTICQGASVTLTASTASSYQWSTGATTQSITVAQSGPYSVTTVNNGCTAVSSTTTVTVVNPPVASISANGLTALCSGGSVTLTAAPATTYLWSNGATTASITVSAAGSYSVTSTANGCSATSAPTLVTLQATPSAAVTTSGSTSFCQGGSVTLTAASAGSYLWSNGANTQSITVGTAGSYTVNVATNGCAATSTPTVVSLLPTPTAVITNTGSTTFCAGGSVVLNAPAAPTGSTFTYVWRLNGNPIAGATAQTYTANAAGTYSLVVTNNQGCTATSANTTVVVNALPTATITATGSTTICAGSSVTLNAPAGAAYVWSNGATTQSIAATTAGAYTVTVNANGCTATSAATNVVVNALPVATISASGATNLCQGSTVTLTASPATTYLWSNGATTPSITVSAAGNYSVTNTTNGCSASSNPTTINVQALPVAGISVIGNTTFCLGGSVTLTASPASSYLWSNGATTQTIVATTAGNYTVQVSANGCSATSTAVPVAVNALPTAVITAAGPTTFCQGGTVTLTAAVASSYLWSNGATTQSITVNTSGTYGVQQTNALGCSAQATPVVVSVQSLPATPQIVANGSLALCPGAIVTLSAPTAASYAWSNGASTQTITVSNAGNYGLTVANAAGCTAAAAPITVSSLAAPTAAITAAGPTTFCQGGSVVLSAAPANSYLWSNGATTQSITVQNAGNYTVQLTENGCSATSAPTTVVVNALPLASITPSGPTTFCQGGSVVLSAPNAATYLWSNGATTEQITVTNDGQYGVSITSNGCTSSATPVSIAVQALPSINVTPSGALTFCEGGSVTLTADPASTYAWSNGQTTQSITVNQTAALTLTSSNGVCSATSAPISITVLAAPALAPIAGVSNACVGSTTTLSNATSGGNWTSFAAGIASVDNNGVVTGLSQGATTVQYSFIYPNGCSVSTSVPFVVNNIAPVSISANGPLSFCAGSSVQLNLPTGYAYNWTNNATGSSILVNTSGSYGATITNAAGCSYQVSPVQVVVNAAPAVAVEASNPSLCSGQSVTLASSLAANTYLWSNGAQTNAITVSQPGTYVLTIQDANGCTGSTVYNLATGITPTATIAAAGPTSFCSGSSVQLNANNYTGGTYLWSNGATTPSVTVNTSGTYAVTITSPSGCTATSNAITLNVLPAPAAAITVSGNTTICSNQSVSLAVSGTGNYLWTNGLTTQSISPTTTGSYGVTVTGSNGCQTSVAPIAITVLTAPTAAISANGPTTFCAGGSVTLTATGGATYVWSNNQTGAQLTPTTSGNYTVTATAANGCQDTESMSVTVNPLPANFIVASGPLTFCQGGSVTLSAQAGNTVLWSNSNTSTSIEVSTAGTYSAQLTSPAGCSVSTNALTVVVNAPTASTLNETALDGYILNGILYTQSGTYVQITTNAAGCDSTITLNLTLTVGLDESNVLTFSVQPNPTDAIFTLVASEALYSNYVIQDAQGKVVATGNLTGTSTTINIDQVARGIYFLKVGEAAEAIRIVKN